MAAPRAAASNRAFRTTGSPPEREPRLFLPSNRKLPFETEAAGPAGGAAVAAEHLLNQSSKACGRQRRAPGFGSPGTRAQPGGLLTMTSVVKTVYSLQPPALSGGLASDTQARTTSKSLLPVKCKDVEVARYHSGGSENDITKTTKLRRENGQVKAADTAFRRNLRKSYKPWGKQKSEEELKDKNQLLEAANKQLHQKLTETQGELKDLTQKVELLEKFQDNCLAILESKGLNPGNETLASRQASTPDPTDSMLLLETLQDELKLFNETAKKQMEELQALKVKLKIKEEERARFMEQQTLYNGQVTDFTTTLEEMEKLLEM